MSVDSQHAIGLPRSFEKADCFSRRSPGIVSGLLYRTPGTEAPAFLLSVVGKGQ